MLRANSIDFRRTESAKGHGNAAFSVLHGSLIVDPIHCTIPSMHVRILVLTVVVWVLVLGAGAVVSCVVSSGVVDDVDDACVDGSALDVIRPGSSSVIQSFRVS